MFFFYIFFDRCWCCCVIQHGNKIKVIISLLSNIEKIKMFFGNMVRCSIVPLTLWRSINTKYDVNRINRLNSLFTFNLIWNLNEKNIYFVSMIRYSWSRTRERQTENEAKEWKKNGGFCFLFWIHCDARIEFFQFFYDFSQLQRIIIHGNWERNVI